MVQEMDDLGDLGANVAFAIGDDESLLQREAGQTGRTQVRADSETDL